MTTVAPPAAITPNAVPSLVEPAAAAAQGQAPLNLAEYLAAMNSNGLASGASPSQLGENILTNLKGFFERSQTMPSRARALVDPAPPPHVSMVVAHRGPAHAALDPSAMRVGPQPAKGDIDRRQMGRVIEAMTMMFDYAIETQLVVRGATQVSGSTNTLLRGQ